MSNLLTHSLSFKKEDIAQYFIDVAFVGNDPLPIMEVLTDVKGTQTLHDISRPSKITRASATGFSGQGSIALTNRDITVAALKAEWEQNGEAFVNSWTQTALASGYSLDDVANMTLPQFYNQVVLPLVADAIQQDKNRQIMFADTLKETMSATGVPTGTADVNMNVYTGVWTNIINDVVSGTIPSGQRIEVTDASGATMTQTATVTGLSTGTLGIKVNGVDYDETFDTDINTTVAAWLTSHKATIEARNSTVLKVTVTAATNVVTVAANYKGGEVLVESGTNLDATGTVTVATTVAAAAAAAMTAGLSVTHMNSMIDAIPKAAGDYEDDMAFICTNSWRRNYVVYLQSVSGVEAAYITLKNGQKVLSFDGKPLIVRKDWDLNIANEFNGVRPHRCILTTVKPGQQNLLFATDGANDDKAIETWYNQDEEMRRYRVKYRAQTTYRSTDLLVVAY